ncbi:hypothetical protein BDZ91DRAFT_46791 [Kalaharituber pfeilii]|nr:hypothetical protein BDZ91DRAFT_46791 [Kalaharituber pfeilii]
MHLMETHSRPKSMSLSNYRQFAKPITRLILYLQLIFYLGTASPSYTEAQGFYLCRVLRIMACEELHGTRMRSFLIEVSLTRFRMETARRSIARFQASDTSFRRRASLTGNFQSWYRVSQLQILIR